MSVRDIIAMTDFIRGMKSCIKRMQRDQRPLVITTGGRPAMVVMTPEQYEAFGQRPGREPSNETRARACATRIKER
ncbi:MAG: hypothetical protein H6813_06615 [Phycisphaeraceae bacterium]|nr:hypothetical protein [Phycisphaeraceae bacterium]MCB9848143.1 hypothetical protein [Phycisphaeraceae bacterium]